MTLHAAAMFHVGIVVPAVDAAVEQFTAAGVTGWTAIGQADSLQRAGGETRPVSLRWAYTTDAPCHVELLEALPLGATLPLGVHHVGYWSGDLDADTARLREDGYVTEFDLAVDAEAAPHIRYLVAPEGPRVELVHTALQDGMRALFTPRL